MNKSDAKPHYRWTGNSFEHVSGEPLKTDVGPFRVPMLNRYRLMSVLSFNSGGPILKRSAKL